MESHEDALAPADAAAALGQAERVRGAVDRRVDRRGYGWARIWCGCAFGAYLGLVMLDAALMDNSGSGAVYGLLVLLICHQALAGGVRRRWPVAPRRDPPRPGWPVVLVVLLGGALLFAVFGPNPPVWTAPLIAVAAFAPDGIAGIRELRRAADGPASPRGHREALPPPVRASTAALGAVAGLAAAIAVATTDSLLPIVPLVLALALVAFESRSWSLTAAGAVWSPAQWAAFALTAAALAAANLVAPASAWSAPIAGVIVALPLVIAAFLPGDVPADPMDG